MNELERRLKALANRRRLAILKCLKNEKDLSVTSIAVAIKLSLRSTSRHLRTLAAADIIDKEQRSSEAFYRLAKNQKLPAGHIIADL